MLRLLLLLAARCCSMAKWMHVANALLHIVPQPCHCSCVSEQGRSPRPPVKPNQDSFVALAGLGNNPALAVFGVFDGHGPRGEDASNYCRCVHIC